MSTAPTTGDDGPTFPTVTRRYASHPDGEMSLVGWAMFALLIVLLVPLLPLVAVAWLASKLAGKMRR